MRAAAICLASLLLGSSALAQAPPVADDPLAAEGGIGRSEKYPGWVILYRIPDVTIVYPAGPGEDGEQNRLSAERRGATLRALSGTKVRVVADGAMTPADREGNLLLLGWKNRALQGVERPFRHGPHAGTSFSGLVEPDPTVDLLFMTRSPWNAERWLFFWSRIDPEAEMFQSLPTVGSDWAMMSGFRIVRQGMFKPDSAWPPVRDDEAEADHNDAILEVERKWLQHRSERFLIRYDPAATSEAELRQIAATREAALTRAIAGLGDPGRDFRIALFVYPDEESKLTVTGIGGAAHAWPRDRQLHMIRTAALSPSEHEEIHLVARAVLGPTSLSVLYEGLALAREGAIDGTSLELAAAALLEQGAWPRLADVLDDAAARKGGDRRRLPAAGLLFQWAESKGGRAALGRVLSLEEGTVEALAAAVGAEPAAVEADFRRFVEEKAAGQADEIAFLKLEREAAQRHLASDWQGLIAVLEKALALKPGDPQTVFNLASARMRLKDYARAEADLRRLIARETERAPGSMFVVYGHYQLGRVHDLAGRREMALAQYRKVLELPDIKDSRRLAQEAIAVPVTAEMLE